MTRVSLLLIVLAISAKVVNAVSVLALTYLISKRLELSEASLFFSTIAVLMLLGPITRLGVERVLVKGFARQNDTADRSFLLFARNAATQILWISVGSALALFLVLKVGWQTARPECCVCRGLCALGDQRGCLRGLRCPRTRLGELITVLICRRTSLNYSGSDLLRGIFNTKRVSSGLFSCVLCDIFDLWCITHWNLAQPGE